MATREPVELVLLDADGEIRRCVPLDASTHRRGDVWSVELADVAPPVRYAWRIDDGPVLLDPYAREVGGWCEWGDRARGRPHSLLRDGDFDWQGVGRPRVAAGDRVVYELSVRAFTAHPSSGVEAPGTFRGLITKIPYLVDLGVTTVELMPVACWDECEIERRDRRTGGPLRDLWGYDPIALAAPHPCLAADPDSALDEFKTLVRELHRAGLEVVLDVVLNHTGEKELREDDPVYSLAGLAPEIYYLRDEETGRSRDLTGCGNTLNTAHPIVQDLVLDSLRFWAVDCRVDGFRFDLASVLTRGPDGEPQHEPELLARIDGDPVLSGRETGRWLVAEPWDASGLVQLGEFAARGRWSEWNGRFRDDVRRFVRGDADSSTRAARRIAGSPELYEDSDAGALSSVDYVTCHDGFTLADLVAYERKHNEANGEENRDGSERNLSSNCGVEGPSDDPAILECRRRRIRLFLLLLLVARGVPLLRAGDELGRSQRGNNNAYCQDNEIGWLDWSGSDGADDLGDLVRRLVEVRRLWPELRSASFLDLERDLLPSEEGVLAMWIGGFGGAEESRADSRLLLVVNVTRRVRSLRLPEASWNVVVDAVGDDTTPGCRVDPSADAVRVEPLGGALLTAEAA